MAKIANNTGTIKIVMIDDHKILLDVLSRQFQDDRKFEVAGVANTVASTENLLANNVVDVVLLDIELDEESGLDAVGGIRAMQEDVRIVVLSMFDHPFYRERAFRLGVDAYAAKGVSFSVLRDFLADGLWDNRSENEQIWCARRRGQTDYMSLSERELQVVQMLGRGMREKEVADLLDIGISSVSTYLRRAMRKTNFDNRAEFFRCASSLGIEVPSGNVN